MKKRNLKKLDLFKEKVTTISGDEASNINGGLFHSRVMCLQSKADAGCTSHTRCNGTASDAEVTIFCIDF